MDHEESWATQGIDDGPQGQQSALRTWKPSLGQSVRAGKQPEAAAAGVSSAEVFDILNAGPRHRFTANGLIVSNCREGYNDPGIQAVAVYRPTKSRGLAEQIKGRGCRPLRGCVNSDMTREERLAAIAASDKPNCMIVDLVGITGMADCASTAHILAQGKPDEVIERANANATKKDGPIDMAEEVRKAQREIDEEREKARQERIERERREQAEADRRAKLRADVRYSTVQVGQGGGHGARADRQRRVARMPFGKHKGELIAEIPSGYLRAITQGDWCKTEWIRKSAAGVLAERRGSTPRPPIQMQKSLDEINAMLAGGW